MSSLYGVSQTRIPADDELYELRSGGLYMRSSDEIEAVRAKKEREREDKVLAEADAIRARRTPPSAQFDPNSAYANAKGLS